MKTSNLTNWKNILMLVVMGMLVVVLVFVVSSRISTNTLALSPMQLSETELRNLALQMAQNAGLQGNPTAEQYTFMPLGEWLTRIEVQSPNQIGTMTRSSQTLVYKVEGSIPTLSMPGYGASNVAYSALVITLNPQDGTLISMGAYLPGTVPNL